MLAPLLGIILLAGLGWVVRGQAPCSTGEQTVYGISGLYKGVFICMGAISVLMCYALIFDAADGQELSGQVLGVGFFVMLGLMGPLALPGPITVDETGIRGKIPWWGRQRHIDWTRLAEVREPAPSEAALAPLTLIGTDGVILRHTGMHVGRAQLLAQIAARRLPL